MINRQTKSQSHQWTSWLNFQNVLFAIFHAAELFFSILMASDEFCVLLDGCLWRRDAEGPESTAEMYNLTKRNNEIKESPNEEWLLSLLLLSLMTELRMEYSHSSLISLINYIIFYFLVNSHVSIVRNSLPPTTAGPELVKWRRRSISVHTLLIAIHRTLRISGDLTSWVPLRQHEESF